MALEQDRLFWSGTALGVTVCRETIAIPDLLRLAIAIYPFISLYFHLGHLIDIADDEGSHGKMTKVFRTKMSTRRRSTLAGVEAYEMRKNLDQEPPTAQGQGEQPALITDKLALEISKTGSSGSMKVRSVLKETAEQVANVSDHTKLCASITTTL